MLRETRRTSAPCPEILWNMFSRHQNPNISFWKQDSRRVGRDDDKEVREVAASQKQVKDYDRLEPGLHRLENVLEFAGGASDNGDQQAGLADGFLDIFMKNARSLQSDERLEEL